MVGNIEKGNCVWFTEILVTAVHTLVGRKELEDIMKLRSNPED